MIKFFYYLCYVFVFKTHRNFKTDQLMGKPQFKLDAISSDVFWLRWQVLVHFWFVLMNLGLNVFLQQLQLCVNLWSWIKPSHYYSYDLKRWHMELLNIGGQLFLLVVPLMLHSPGNQYFLQDCESYNQKYETKCYQ